MEIILPPISTVNNFAIDFVSLSKQTNISTPFIWNLSAMGRLSVVSAAIIILTESIALISAPATAKTSVLAHCVEILVLIIGNLGITRRMGHVGTHRFSSIVPFVSYTEKFKTIWWETLE